MVMVAEGGGGGVGGGVGLGVWYFVHICSRWNEGGGKIAPSQIITERGGGFQKSQGKKSKIILVPCSIYIK